MNNTTEIQPTLVLGGTGKTGRRIVQRLTALGHPVRVASRRGTPPFEWEDPWTWPALVDGAAAVYIAYSPDVAVPGAAEIVGGLARLAVERGASRLVLLSGRGEPAAEVAEQAVRESGAALTVLRSAWFAQNFSEDFMLQYVRDGLVALPGGDTPEPFVDADDIADVAVAALTGDRHIGEVYELTGPRLLTFADAVAEIASASGRDVEYVPVSIEEHASRALAGGVPVEVVELMTYLFGEVLDGRNSRLADGVQRALGRAPRDFGAFASDAARTGVWDAAVASGV